MQTTIDKAGRVVIPASIRSKVGLKPGTKLEVIAEDYSVRLLPAVPGPRLIKRGKRWVAQPTASREELSQLDISKIIEAERDRWPW